MTRRCSHCCNNGHNTRTCPARGGPMLFGVRLTAEAAGGSAMTKSASMGNLSSPQVGGAPTNADVAPGYVSDGSIHASRTERKKGTPWTEEEHRMFLVGLQKLGKGDWRGIARNYVVSRTPTQVASHAQKYFIRQSNASRRKRRSSLFDMVADVPIDPKPVLEEQFAPKPSSTAASTEESRQPSLSLSLDQACEPIESSSNITPLEHEETTITKRLPPVVPLFISPYVPIPYPFHPPLNCPITGEDRRATHQILKPIPVHLKDPMNADELIGMSKLSLRDSFAGRMEPFGLSLELLGASSRQSAFHASPAIGGEDLSQSGTNMIHAV